MTINGTDTPVNNLQNGRVFVIKHFIISHSHSGQIKAIAPTLICFLNLLSILLSQFLNILVILHGGNKVEATWMTDHIDIVKRYWKNKCFIDSATENTFLASVPIPFCKIVFG
jgi:hypothetical protein